MMDRMTAEDAVDETQDVEPTSRPRDVITESDHELIKIWSQAWRYPGMRNAKVMEVTGLSVTRAAQRLNELIDMPEALAAHPVEVNRLQRIRRKYQRQ